MSARGRAPDFIIIGAMKAGTTTLFDDLALHPDLFGSDPKEPWSLNDDRVLTDAGRSAYFDLFKNARPDQRCFEGSTSYSQLPVIDGVVERAKRVIGDDVRIVYIVREPIARVVSHHHHLMVGHAWTPDIDRAVREDDRFIAFSKYAMQARAWIDALGRDRVLVLRFDELVRARRDTVAAVERFVGVDPRPDLVDDASVSNKSDGKRVPTGLVRRVGGAGVYRRYLRPLLPRPAIETLKRFGTRETHARHVLPTDDTFEFIWDRLEEDYAELASIVTLPDASPAPVWTRDESRAALEKKRAGAAAPLSGSA